jgi:hypothetical protein
VLRDKAVGVFGDFRAPLHFLLVLYSALLWGLCRAYLPVWLFRLRTVCAASAPLTSCHHILQS